jgi:hypothetical protein
MDMNINLMSAFSTQKMNSLALQGLGKRYPGAFAVKATEQAPSRGRQPSNAWGARYTTPLRESAQQAAATARVDETFAQIQQTLGDMRDIAQQIQDGHYEGEFTQLPQDEGYQEALDALIDSAPPPPEQGDETAQPERPHIGMLAREFSTMADKVSRLLDETLAEDRELLRDKVFSGSDPTFESLENIMLSNSIDGTLQDLSSAMTTTLEVRGKLDATRSEAQNRMASAVEDINQAYRMDGGLAPEEASDAAELVEKIRRMLTDSPTQAMAAQGDQRYMLPSELLAGLIY